MFGVRNRPAHSFRCVEACRQVAGIIVARAKLAAVSEGDLAQQHQASRAIVRSGNAVVGRLGHHIGKVHAFAKHVAGRRSLWWSDAQALFFKLKKNFSFILVPFCKRNFYLREQADKVGET